MNDHVQFISVLSRAYSLGKFKDINMGGFSAHSTPNFMTITWKDGRTKAKVVIQYHRRARIMTSTLFMETDEGLSIDIKLPPAWTAMDVLPRHSILVPLHDGASRALEMRVGSRK